MSQAADPGDARNPVQSRRGALGTLGFAAFAFLGSNTQASAFFSRKTPKVIVNSSTTRVAADLGDLPPDWVARQGTNLRDYAAYLSSLRLQRLTPRQVIEAHAKRHGTVWNSLPPRGMWRQMVPTMRALDRVAIELGQPVGEIISAYRSPAYNATCRGASRGSWHQANVALDVKFATRPGEVARTARALRSRGLFSGGVGRYGSFTHIDTRGQNVDW